jgi:autotransporter adhesin
VGVGQQNGETALAVGYQRIVNNHFGVSLGGAFSSNDKSVGAGASLSW